MLEEAMRVRVQRIFGLAMLCAVTSVHGQEVPVSSGPLPAAADTEFGFFIGDVVASWGGEERNMTLMQPFEYVTREGVHWLAPAGSVIDGASIPRFAWTFIGGPFEGAYRRASVIHDVGCIRKDRPWQDVHLAFYTAMRASNVGVIKAKTMYAAVYHFGPRWTSKVSLGRFPIEEARMEAGIAVRRLDRKGDTASSEIIRAPDNIIAGVIRPSGAFDAYAFVVQKPQAPQLSEEDFKKLVVTIEATDPSLEAIEDFVVQKDSDD